MSEEDGGTEVGRLKAALMSQQRELTKQRKEINKLREQRDELKSRFDHSRDESAIRARWGLQASTYYNQLDAMRGQRPSVEDAMVFEEGDRILLRGLIERLQALADLYRELQPGSRSYVEAATRLPMVVDSEPPSAEP